jgi:hypothetical protein
VNKPNQKPYKPRGTTERGCNARAALIVAAVIVILLISAAGG